MNPGYGMTTLLYSYQFKRWSAEGLARIWFDSWRHRSHDLSKSFLQFLSFSDLISTRRVFVPRTFLDDSNLQFRVVQPMDSPTEHFLHGGIDKLESCEQDNPAEAQQYILRNRLKNKYLSQTNIISLSFTLNIILITSLLLSWAKAAKSSQSKYGRLISEYASGIYWRLVASLLRDVPIEWNPYSPYGTGNEDETNRTIMWESLDVSLGSVSLDSQWAIEHGLPPAQPFPWDKSRSLYLLNGHHSLHCMVRYPVSCAFCLRMTLLHLLCAEENPPLGNYCISQWHSAR